MEPNDQSSVHGSVTLLVKQLRHGHPDVMHDLFEVYFSRLVALAGTLLPNHQRRVADEEDLAMQVLASFLMDASAGRMPDLRSRQDVWRLLAKRITQRAAGHHRDQTRQKRGGGHVAGESAFRLPDGGWDPAGIAQVAEKNVDELGRIHSELLECLPSEELREIASLVLQGHSVRQISSRIKRSQATVYRKLTLIKDAWHKES